MSIFRLWGRSPFLESSKKVNWYFSQKFGTSALGSFPLRQGVLVTFEC